MTKVYKAGIRGLGISDQGYDAEIRYLWQIMVVKARGRKLESGA